MIVDLYEAVDRMLWAIAVWIVAGAAVAAPVVLFAGWAVTRVVKWAWRAARRACGASGGPNAGLDDRDAPEASQGPYSDSGYEEAA